MSHEEILEILDERSGQGRGTIILEKKQYQHPLRIEQKK